jgi:tetratricopeptide (TPR) repeat protein
MADSPRIEELRRRVQSDPASIAFAALAEEYRRAGRFEEAVETCTTGLQRHPSYLSARVTLGRALLEVGRYEEAQQELEHVLKLAPENLAAIRGLAEIHHRRGDEPHDDHYHAAMDTARREAAAEQAVAGLKAPPPAPIDLPLNPPAPEPEPAVASGIRLKPSVPYTAAPAATDEVETAAPRVDPALAGLEEFLAAILRARAQRSAQ